MTNPFRNLPSVNEILELPALVEAEKSHPRDEVVASVREALDDLRGKLRNGEQADTSRECLAETALARLRIRVSSKLRPVINATGIVLHTNLGRAPLADQAVQAVQESASGYLNLELSLETGKRSSRQDAIREWVCRLTGSESATVVNNNAAATVLVLRALCRGREVIVSRGQMIEIGGSFRIPDIMGVSGATLREVGTTNITRIDDYARVIGPETGALMQIHTSNYRIQGFTKSVALKDLVALGHKHNLPVIDDAGSGALVNFERFGFSDEPVIRDSIEAGADVVLFSGDKLLGGPQAGIIAGRADLIKRLEKDPLMRAFRLDKMTLAALEATLRLYLDEEQALREVPVLRMLSLSLEELQRRAESIASQLRELSGIASVETMRDHAFVGGGSLPAQSMETVVVCIEPANCSEEELATRLRSGTPAVMARMQQGRVLLDLRTVKPEQEALLIEAIKQALGT